MAFTLTLTNGTTTLDFLDKSNGYQLMDGGLDIPAPDRVEVKTGQTMAAMGSRLVDYSYKNRRITINLALYGTDYDTVISKINNLNTLLSKGMRYRTNDEGSKVELNYKWDGATNTTKFGVITGTFNLPSDIMSLEKLLWYNDSDSRYELYDCELELECEPFGYGTDIKLYNMVPNASFEEDADGDGEADFWTLIHASNTGSIDTSIIKYGDSSQKLVYTFADNFDSDLFPCAASTAYRSSIWVYVTAGTAALEAYGSASGYIAGTSAQTANSTWTKLELDFTTGASDTTVKLSVLGIVGTTVYVDGAMMMLASDVIDATGTPDSWISYTEALDNTLDEYGTTNRVNYIGYDIQGTDAPSPIRMVVQNLDATDDRNQSMVGMRVGTLPTMAYIGESGNTNRRSDAHFVCLEFEDSDSFQVYATGTGKAEGASASGSATNNVVEAVMSAGSSTNWYWEMTSDTAKTIDRVKGSYRVVIRSKVTSGTASDQKLYFVFKGTAGLFTYYTSPKVTAESSGYRYYDMGVINFPLWDQHTGVPRAMRFYVYSDIDSTGSSVTGRFDCVYFLPTDRYKYIAHSSSGLVTGQNTCTMYDNMEHDDMAFFVSQPEVDTASYDALGGKFSQSLGEPLYFLPGDSNRFYILNGVGATSATMGANADQQVKVRLWYRPSYLHVRGA